MRKLPLTVLAGALGLLAASPAAAQSRYASAEAEMDIVETAVSAGSFETLVAAVKTMWFRVS